MIPIIAQLIFAEFVLLYISNIDIPRNKNFIIYKPENKILFLVVNSIICFLLLLFIFYAKQYLLSFFTRIIFLFAALSMVYICIYFLQFAEILNRFGSTLFKLFSFATGYFLFFMHVKDIQFSDTKGFIISAASLFPAYSSHFNITWFSLSILLFVYILPFISALIMIITFAVRKQYGALKQAYINTATLFIPWAGVIYIVTVSNRFYPGASVIMFLFFVSLTALIIKRSSHSDLNTFNHTFFFLNIGQYAVPTILLVLLYKYTHTLYFKSPAAFLCIFGILTLLLLIGTNRAGEHIIAKRRIANKMFCDSFEKMLKTISYEDKKDKITAGFFAIIQQNLHASSMTVLVPNGNNTYCFLYDSKAPGITEVSPVFLKETTEEAILKTRSIVIISSDLEGTDTFGASRIDIAQLFNQIHAKACIVISSRKHIFSLIFLGNKLDKTKYNKYDISAVTKLYSYFFVFSYYLRNIAPKKSVEAITNDKITANQIISAITRDNAPVAYSLYDVGYFSKPASVSSGDFIDIIRLNEDHHLFVIGNMSGKGLSVNISTLLLKSTIRSYLSVTHDFKKLVIKINSYIRNTLPKGTVFYGMFALMEFSTNTFYYINCGIPSITIFSKNINKIIDIQGSPHILGFKNDISGYLSVKSLRLNKGDILITYTKGIIDAPTTVSSFNKKYHIQELLLADRDYPADRIAQFIYNDFSKTESIEKDVSILIIKKNEK
jgi:hypothetical protein